MNQLTFTYEREALDVGIEKLKNHWVTHVYRQANKWVVEWWYQ